MLITNSNLDQFIDADYQYEQYYNSIISNNSIINKY